MCRPLMLSFTDIQPCPCPDIFYTLMMTILVFFNIDLAYDSFFFILARPKLKHLQQIGIKIVKVNSYFNSPKPDS